MNRPLRRRRRLLSSSSSSFSEPPPPPPQHPEEEDENPGQDIVIAGAGIMGISTAYYLVQLAVAGEEASTRRKIRSITLVDPTGTIGACASGKAGGLLAQDWRDGTPLEALQRSGFALHQQLAEEDDVALETTPTPTTNTPTTTTTTTAGTPKRISKNPTDYRRLTCVSIAVDETINGTPTSLSPQRLPQKPPSKKLTDVEWVTPAVVLVDNDDDDVGEDVSAGESGGVVILGDETTIAQVHPRKFCERLWERIRSSTSNTTTSTPITTTLRQGRIVKAQTIPIATAGGGATAPLFKMTGVDLADGTHLPADVLLVACGPWTYEANTWFDDYGQVIPDITSVKCHSILVNATPAVAEKAATTTTATTTTTNTAATKTASSNRESMTATTKSASNDATWTPEENTNTNTNISNANTLQSYSQAVFFDSNGAIGEEGDLEVYPRLDGDLYVNGYANAEGRCRESPNEERIEDEKIQQLRAAMELVYGRPKLDEMKEDNDDDSPTSPPSPRAVEHTQQVCYWPETPDGLPIIGKIPAIEGVYVAAGHSVWGIVQGPATGKAVAELILYGKARCIDLTPFQVERYYRNSS